MSDANYGVDDWNVLSTGLLDDVVAQISSPEFSYHPDHNDGKSLALRFTLTEADGTIHENQRMGPGNKWVPVDGGRGIEREDGKPANFHESTQIGLAIKELRENGVDMNALVRERKAPPTRVEFWDGMTFHFKQIKHDYKGDIGEVTYLVPDAVITNGASAPAPAPAVATQPAATPAAAPVAAVAKKAAAPSAPANNGVDPAIRQQLFDIAYAAASHEDYQAQALAQVPQAQSDPAVFALVEGIEVWNEAVAAYEAANP